MKIPVSTLNNGYDITIERGVLSKVANLIDLKRKCLIVTDDNIPTSYIDTIKNQCKEDLLKELEIIDVEKIDSIELNKNLAKFDKTIIELTDYNKEIVFDEEEEKTFDNLAKVNSDRLAVEKYYNDNASKFNNSINGFPSGIISKIKKYKERELFSNEKEEIFEILKK